MAVRFFSKVGSQAQLEAQVRDGVEIESIKHSRSKMEKSKTCRDRSRWSGAERATELV